MDLLGIYHKRSPRLGGWQGLRVRPCEDRVLDGPASGEKGSKGRNVHRTGYGLRVEQVVDLESRALGQRVVEPLFLAQVLGVGGGASNLTV